MSDDPRVLKKVLLEDASTEQKREFAQMLARQCAEAEIQAQGHRCWLFVPTASEYARMAAYAAGAPCPKCGKGRVALEIYKGSLGETFWLRCYWGETDCSWKEVASDDE